MKMPKTTPQVRSDTEKAIELFKLFCGWEENQFAAHYGPLTPDTLEPLAMRFTPLRFGMIYTLVIWIQTCRRLKCEATLAAAAALLTMQGEMYDHLDEHDRAESNE